MATGFARKLVLAKNLASEGGLLMMRVCLFFVFFGVAASLPSAHAEHTLSFSKSGMIRIALSQRGQSALKGRFPEFMESLGLSIDQLQILKLNYNIDREHALLNSQSLVAFAESLHPWLPSLVPLDRPYQIEAEGIRFQSAPPELDIKALSSTSRGLVLDFSFELSDASLEVDRVLLEDLSPLEEKPFGSLGAQGIVLSSALEMPLRLEGQIVFEMHGSRPVVKVQRLSSNLSESPLEHSLDSFWHPSVSLLLNGHEHELNEEHLRAEIQDRLPRWMEQVQVTLSEALGEELESRLNQEIASKLPRTLGFESAFPAPAKPLSPSDPELRLSATVEKLSYSRVLEFTLSTRVSDPINPSLSRRSVVGASYAPSMRSLGVESADVVVLLDSELINRVVQASFERGYFRKLNMGGQAFALRSAPQVLPLYGQKQGSSRFRIPVSVEVPRGDTFKEVTLMRDPVKVNFDVICRLEPSRNAKGVELVLDSVDTTRSALDYDSSVASFEILEDSFRKVPTLLPIIGIVKHIVRPQVRKAAYKALKEKLDDTTKAWKSKRQSIAGILELVPSIMGVEMKLRSMQFHPSGNLVFYMDIGGSK